MKSHMRIIFGLLGTMGAFSAVWMILGLTANFQKPIDLVGTVSLILIGIPLIAASVICLYFCFSRRVSINLTVRMVVIVVSMVVLGVAWPTLNGIPKEGWLRESITTDVIKTTADQQYQYRIEFINLYQKNQHSRLFIKSLESAEETRIAIDLPMSEINGLIESHADWVTLTPTDSTDIYHLSTTDELPIPIEHFEINVKTDQAKRVSD
ncbi:hypothetical protein B9G55_05820 [Saccharibacillus sp. O16]|nr:hypothetical protein B9G55_05820 [Saccharibacillus sp. O16]